MKRSKRKTSSPYARVNGNSQGRTTTSNAVNREDVPDVVTVSSDGPTVSNISNVPNNVPVNVPSNLSSTMPSNVPINVSSSVPSNMPINVPSNVPINVPSNVPSSMSSDTPNSVPTSVPSAQQAPPQVERINIEGTCLNNVQGEIIFQGSCHPLISITDELGFNVEQSLKEKIWNGEYIQFEKLIETDQAQDNEQILSVKDGNIVFKPKQSEKKKF